MICSVDLTLSGSVFHRVGAATEKARNENVNFSYPKSRCFFLLIEAFVRRYMSTSSVLLTNDVIVHVG